MLIWTTLDIADGERALVYRRGRLTHALRPGRVRVAHGSHTTTYSVQALRLHSSEVAALWSERKDLLETVLRRETVSDTELGLVYRNGQLVDIIAPGTEALYWREEAPLELVRVTLNDVGHLPAHYLPALTKLRDAQHAEALRSLQVVEVPEQHFGALYVDGQYRRALAPGRHGFARIGRNVQVKVLDLRLQFLEISGQEMLTRDRVSLRLNVSVGFAVAQPEQVLAQVSDTRAYIYRTVQLALREVVGERDLDGLLTDKDAVNTALDGRVRPQLQAQGFELRDVGLKDTILPGDMRLILNQVVEAQKAAEANVIRRREETQAMRSLHNTAKMMEGNPILLRLKELEALEQVSGRIGQLSVYGGLEGLLKGLVTLNPDN